MLGRGSDACGVCSGFMPHGFMIACGSADEADGGKEKVNNGTDPELEVYHVYGRTAGQELS